MSLAPDQRVGDYVPPCFCEFSRPLAPAHRVGDYVHGSIRAPVSSLCP